MINRVVMRRAAPIVHNCTTGAITRRTFCAAQVEKESKPQYSGPIEAKKSILEQFKMSHSVSADEHFMPHPLYIPEEIENIEITHRPPATLGDKIAYNLMTVARRSFDFVTGYGENMTEEKYLQRMLFLETIAGVPGMVGGMVRHMTSLRAMRRDYGWIHTQEEAVKTYTKCLEDIDSGNLTDWKQKPAPGVARRYWQLPEGSTMRDVILAVRADEAVHREVNHTFSDMPLTAANPF